MDTFDTITVPNLPIGLTIERSMDRILDTGLRNGCAVTHDLLSQNWFASDFTCGPAQNPASYTVHFGPYATRAQARMQLDGGELEYLDEHGTDGISTWLILP